MDRMLSGPAKQASLSFGEAGLFYEKRMPTRVRQTRNVDMRPTLSGLVRVSP